MSKNHSSSDQQTDNLKARYQEILADEQKKRPPYKDQSFFQKVGAQTTRLGSAYCTLGSGIMACSPYFFMAPAYYGLASKISQDYDKLRNPEEFYQQNALERLAKESGMSEGLTHLNRMDLYRGRAVNADYADRMDQVFPKLCERLGIEKVKYKRPYESFGKGIVGGGFNRAAGFVSEATSKIPSPFSKAPAVSDEELLSKLDSYSPRLSQPRLIPETQAEQKPQSFLSFIAQTFLNILGLDSRLKTTPTAFAYPVLEVETKKDRNHIEKDQNHIEKDRNHIASILNGEKFSVKGLGQEIVTEEAENKWVDRIERPFKEAGVNKKDSSSGNYL